ncbi:glycosyltransferase family 4 protein [Pedobacter deserti]|uniref:glycosyltransferase family 4 protein n=1 Tax=Pedobacter deserti TaxID=2817382 RepID=UPI00210CB552|nr:glycosyltransferase family 4 protein [Pedobacter sp. SYSU D00382]
MKILYLTQYAVDGQFQSQFYNYALYIDKTSHIIEVAYLFPFAADNTLIEAYKRNNIKVSSLGYKGVRISLGKLWAFIKFLKSKDFDIVHSQHPIAGFYNKIGTTLVNLIYRRNIKIIVEQRCVKKNLSFFARILETLTHPLANLVLCSSNGVQRSYFGSTNSLDTHFTKKVSRFTFYNSIDISTLNRSPSGRRAPSDGEIINICVIGRNEPVKQPILVIKAIEHLGRDDVRLHMAGSGSLDAELKDYIQKNALSEKVFLLGNIDWIPKLLQDSDIYINYSKHEGLCKSLLEAMASGVPSIASRVDGNTEVLGENNEFGILVVDKSPQKLAEAINQLLSDKELYSSYSKAGAIRSQEFDVKQQVLLVADIYKRLKP